MKIAMICGSWPPERCGVGDYSATLCKHLPDQGADVVPIRRDNWSLASAMDFRRQLVEVQPDMLHIQYPSVGYGRSFLPALTPYLLPKTPLVVTLHEFEVFKSYRWPWFYPFAKRAEARLFSRAGEADAFAKRFPKRSGRDLIVPIGSNIPVAPKKTRISGGTAFFGLFWPGKGLEEFLKFAEIMKSKSDGKEKLAVIGAPVAGQEAFSTFIREKTSELGVALHEGLPPEEVALKLAEHEFAYLPFPDGVDERRGSLAAAIVNGCIVITRHGPQTPDWLVEATVNAETPEAAADLLQSELTSSEVKVGLQATTAMAAKRYDWSQIARQHAELYRQLV